MANELLDLPECPPDPHSKHFEALGWEVHGALQRETDWVALMSRRGDWAIARAVLATGLAVAYPPTESRPVRFVVPCRTQWVARAIFEAEFASAGDHSRCATESPGCLCLRYKR